jgi:hypothetical protein
VGADSGRVDAAGQGGWLTRLLKKVASEKELLKIKDFLARISVIGTGATGETAAVKRHKDSTS